MPLLVFLLMSQPYPRQLGAATRSECVASRLREIPTMPAFPVGQDSMFSPRPPTAVVLSRVRVSQILSI